MNMDEPKTLADFVTRFLAWREEMGHPVTTIRANKTDLNCFVAWCKTRGLVLPTDVSRKDAERFQQWLHYYRQPNHLPLSIGTQNNRMATIRVFFGWLLKRRHILFNPTTDLELPKLVRALPSRVFAVKEVEKFLRSVNTKDPEGLRDRAIFELLYLTGLRRAEATRLKLHDIDRHRCTLCVRAGKGGKDRVVPLGERALEWIERYTLEVRSNWASVPDEGWLFLTPRGGKISPESLSRIGKERMKAAGLWRKGLACHVFRHTTATLMLEGGADIRYIQSLLGHERLSTTQIYTKVSISKLKEVHEKTHPANKRKAKALRSTGPAKGSADGGEGDE